MSSAFAADIDATKSGPLHFPDMAVAVVISMRVGAGLLAGNIYTASNM